MARFQFRHLFACVLTTFSVSSLTAMPARADITLDGTLGPSGPLTGPNYEIPAAVGEQVGSNLFHSFGVFSINSDESATFTGPSGIENVLGRVTGGESSSIDGELNSDIPGANLYLINPAGIMFGPNAQLHVDGSFHASTADYVRLGQDGVFAATNPGASTLTVAPPSAFGFLDNNPAPITVQGSDLQVPESETFSIVSGNIHIAGGGITAPSGRINIASVASPGEVKVAGGSLNVDSFARLGNIRVSQEADVNASGEGGGSIIIRSGQLAVDNSFIDASTSGSRDGGGINIILTGNLAASNGGRIKTITSGEGKAGDIVIEAANVTLATGTQVDSSSSSTGDAGDLTVNTAGSVFVFGLDRDGNQSGLFSNTFGDGDAGNLSVFAQKLIVDDGLVLTKTKGDGEAGVIHLELEDLSLTAGGQVDASSIAAGDANSLTVNVTGNLFVSGHNSNGDLSGLYSNTFGKGDAGRLSITAGQLNMKDGHITAGSNSSGSGGDVLIQAGQVTLTNTAEIDSTANDSGHGGNVKVIAMDGMTIKGGPLDATDPTGIFNNSNSTGAAGNLTITTQGTLVMNGGRILTRTYGDADGGTITISARNLTLSNGAQIFSGIGNYDPDKDTVIGSPSGTGRGGDLNIIVADTIRLSGTSADKKLASGLFASTQTGRGAGGNISVASQDLMITDDAAIGGTSIRDAKGNAGNIEVNVERLEIIDGGTVITDSGRPSTGDAGNITIDVAGTAQLTDGTIEAEAVDTTGGNIDMNAGSLQLTQDSQVTSSVFGDEETTGGNITINGGSLILLDNSQVNASADQGNGGVITINSDVFLHDRASVREVPDASSGTAGNDGTVEVNSPDTDIAGSITRLPISFLNAAALLSQRCAARSAEDTSSFVIIGRGGVPSGPDDWTLSGYTEGGSAAMKAESGGTKRSQRDLSQTIRPRVMAIKLTCASKPAL